MKSGNYENTEMSIPIGSNEKHVTSSLKHSKYLSERLKRIFQISKVPVFTIIRRPFTKFDFQQSGQSPLLIWSERR
mgnify:CR=1 FL=1